MDKWTIYNFSRRITADKLNIRKGPATSYDIVGNKVKRR